MTADVARVRLFFALWPGPGARRRLVALRDRWRWSGRARPIRDESLHLTLHFLGAIEIARVPPLVATLDDRGGSRTHRFVLRFDRMSVWSNGIAALEPRPHRALDAVHADLREPLEAHGFTLERRAWRPHVTLARDARGSIAPSPDSSIEPLEWRVDGFALVASSPRDGYRVVARWA